MPESAELLHTSLWKVAKRELRFRLRLEIPPKDHVTTLVQISL
jgi:hypothetical protein